ncbi:ABC transporter ATP-binding protein [Sulfurirhabdus autotrophica]|uniref:Iron complex transport system ATP-binding protein n=1 Tax=Sulfurirhabdus autotrophica TaxID=1706046 RepID=A0A4R3Y6N5_9PROT|nr:ABC transporter ATP-binding protein [Sulfurirhabdus autotrophica]TCV85883.1 iron complex transport system ATP-binding protein [Sulfurirhabdus autotrophica]
MTLSAENLTLGYSGKSLYQNLNVTMLPGECWGILGRNGCGKSTLLHALGGLIKPLSGSVSIQGNPVASLPRITLAQTMGLLLQEESSLFSGTVLDYVRFGRFPHNGSLAGRDELGEALVQNALEQMELNALALRLVGTLSGGERQRVRIAMLLAQSPVIYGLDEPLLHLDICHQATAMKLLRDLAATQRKTVVMVLHDTLWASRYCDNVLLLYENGNALSGAAKDLLSKDNLEELYGCKMQALIIDKEVHYVPY